MPKFSKVIIIVSAIVLILFAIAIVLVKSNFSEADAQAVAREQLTEILQREASVGGVSLSIFPLGIKIKDVEVANNKGKGFSEQPLLILPELIAKINILKLLTLQVTIDGIFVNDMVLNYEVMADGRTSLDGLAGQNDSMPKPEAKPLDFSEIELPGTVQLNKFQVNNAKIIYLDKKSGQKVVLGEINQDVKLSLDSKLEAITTTGLLTIDEISFEDKTSGIKKGKINVSVEHDLALNLRKQVLKVNSMSLGFQTVKINVDGWVTDFLKDEIDLDLKIASNKMSLADLFKEIPKSINPEVTKLSAGGIIEFNTIVKGKLGKNLPVINGKLSLEKLFISHSDVPAKLQDLNAQISFTDNSLKIAPMSLKLDQHPVNINLDVVGITKSPMVIRNFSLDAKVDFEPLFTLASKIVELPKNMVVKGLLTANISAKGKVDLNSPENISVSGKALLSNVYVNAPEIIPVAVMLNGNTNFSNTSITNNLSVKVGQSDVSTAIKVEDYLVMVLPKKAAKNAKVKLKVDVKSNNLNLDELMPPPSVEQEEIKEETGATALPEIPVNLVADININLARTVFYRMTMSNFNMNTKLNNQILNNNITANIYEGKLKQSMTADLKNPNNGVVKMLMEIVGVEANDLISNANDNLVGDSKLQKKLRDLDNTVYSKMNLNVDINTQGTPATFVDNMVGTIVGNLKDGSLKGTALGGSIMEAVSGFEVAGKKPLKNLIKGDLTDVKFTKLDIDMTVDHGVVTIKDMKMHKTPIGDLALGGKVKLNGDLNMHLDNTLSPDISKKLDNATSGLTQGVAGAISNVGGKYGKMASNKVGGISLYPKNEKNQAMLYYFIGGNIDKPKVGLDAKRMAKETAKSQGMGDDGIKGAAKEKADDLKKQAKEKLAEQKSVAKSKAKAEVKKVKTKAQKEVKKTTKKVKKQATKHVKDAANNSLKKFGF